MLRSARRYGHRKYFLMDNGSCPRLHEQTVNSRLQEKGETERNGDWERERDTLFRDVMFPRDGAEACRRKASLWPACAWLLTHGIFAAHGLLALS